MQIYRRVILLLWWIHIAVVVILSLTPGWVFDSMHLEASGLSDKLIHFLNYFLLGGLAALAFATRGRAVAAIIAGALLGLVLEFTQTLVPGRAFEIHDFMANNVGILSGTALGFVLRRILFVKDKLLTIDNIS